MRRRSDRGRVVAAAASQPSHPLPILFPSSVMLGSETGCGVPSLPILFALARIRERRRFPPYSVRKQVGKVGKVGKWLCDQLVTTSQPRQAGWEGWEVARAASSGAAARVLSGFPYRGGQVRDFPLGIGVFVWLISVLQ